MNISTQGAARMAAQALPAQGGQASSQAAPSNLPDLVIDRFDPSTGFPNQGERIDFSVQVRNKGTVAAGPFTVEVSGDGMRPDRERVAGLAPGASARLRFGPANVGYSPVAWYDARADVGNEVAESEESNNWITTSVSVRDPFPRDPFPNPPRPPFPVNPRD